MILSLSTVRFIVSSELESIRVYPIGRCFILYQRLRKVLFIKIMKEKETAYTYISALFNIIIVLEIINCLNQDVGGVEDWLARKN